MCGIDVYNDSTSIPTRSTPSGTKISSSFPRTSRVSCTNEGSSHTSSLMRASTYLPILSRGPCIAETIGLPGGVCHGFVKFGYCVEGRGVKCLNTEISVFFACEKTLFQGHVKFEIEISYNLRKRICREPPMWFHPVGGIKFDSHT